MGLSEHIGDRRVKSRKMGDAQSQEARVRNDRVRTGRRVLDHLERVMGPIGLDPCGNPGWLFARTTVLLPEYTSAKLNYAPGAQRRIVFGDGLKISWDGHGLVFVNNPWSQCAPWIERASSMGDEIVMLVQARMNAGWMHTHGFQNGLEAVGFTHGRVPYETDVKMPQPPFHSVFLYFGARRELFGEFIRTMPRSGPRAAGGGTALYVR